MKKADDLPPLDLGKALLGGMEEALAHARGAPAPGTLTHPGLDVREIRQALRMTQREFAAAYDLSYSSVRDWEQGRAQPDRPARALLRLIAREPELVRRTLAK